MALGGYDWTVLAVESGRALLIARDVVGKRAYHADNEVTTWEACSLRAYLNGEFLDGFRDGAGRLVLGTEIANRDNPAYGTAGGGSTTDKVFLLSLDEARLYFSEDAQRIARYQGSARWWWLRSPGIRCHAAFVQRDGSINPHGHRVDYAYSGVRPALYVATR